MKTKLNIKGLLRALKGLFFSNRFCRFPNLDELAEEQRGVRFEYFGFLGAWSFLAYAVVGTSLLAIRNFYLNRKKAQDSHWYQYRCQQS